MKKLSICMAMVLLISCFSGIGVLADSGTVFQWFYDFEDYTGGLPDEKWAKTMYDCSPAVVEEGDNKYLSMTNGELSLKFDELLTTGNLHISFKAKAQNDVKRLLQFFYDGRNDEGQFKEYSKTMFLNYADNTTSYYYSGSTKDMTAWNMKHVEGYNFTEWHKFDAVFYNIQAGNNATADYYVDGEKINELPIRISEGKGFKTLSFRVENQTEQTDNSRWYIDDVLVERINNDFGLNGSLISAGPVPRIGARLDIALSDTVDASLLTKENVTITRNTDGSKVTDFEVVDATSNRISIEIHEELGSGTYALMLKPSIVGEFFKKSMIVPVTFRAEYKSQLISTDFINENFDNTTEEELLKNWSFSGDAGNTWELTQGAAEGYGFGQQNAVRKKLSWMETSFNDVIRSGSDFDMSFDMQITGDMDWYFSVMTKGDADPTHNIAIGCNNQSGKIVASENGMEVGLKIVDNNLKASYGNGEWHTIRLERKNLSDGYQYLISVDGGDSYSVPVTRDFQNNAVTGIAFGYKAYDTENALVIDNLMLTGACIAYYPEVESVSVLDIEGNSVSMQDKVTSMAGEIRVVFNTRIAEESMDLISLYEDGQRKTVEYFLDDTGKTSIVHLQIPALLEPSRNYRLEIPVGICSAYSDKVFSDASFSYSMVTRFDDGLRVVVNDYDSDTQTYRFAVSKNNRDTMKATAAVALYKTESKMINDIETTFDKMIGFAYFPIEIEDYWTGTFEYEEKIYVDCMDAPDKTRLFLWSYPEMTPIGIADDGSLIY